MPSNKIVVDVESMCANIWLLVTFYAIKMFIRVKTTPNSPRKSVQIVENNRDTTTGKVKQKIVRYIGIAMDEREEKKLKSLAMEAIVQMKLDSEAASPQMSLLPNQSPEEMLKSLQRQKKTGRKPKKTIDQILPTSQVTLDMIEEESRIIDGVHEVAGHIYDLLGYDKILSNNRYKKILKDLVLCRISNPTSKLSTSKILSRYYMKAHDLDAIYRTMDKVVTKIDDIQKTTFAATTNLMSGDLEIILFDVTTLHFESTESDDVRKFGYSKNFRFNTTQVVLALATNSDGLPVGYELFEGNKAEVKTLIETIDSWKDKFSIGNVCFIGDRAMFSEANLQVLESRNYNYIVAAKLRGMPNIMQEKIMNSSNYSVVKTEEDELATAVFRYEENDLAFLQTKGQVKKYKEVIKQNKNRVFVVGHSKNRAKHDAKRRCELLEKITKQLDKTSNSAKLISNSAIKKYTSSTGKSRSELDTNKIELDEKWDGIHGVITNIKDGAMKHKNILDKYRGLVKIEDCFRVNKTTLKMRPIYHFKPERIRSHIAICYVAFSLVRQIEYRVKLLKKISIASIIEELNSVQSSIYVHKNTKDRYRVPGNFSNDARKIYQAIGIKRNIDAYPVV